MRPFARVLIAFIAWSAAFAVLSPIVFFAMAWRRSQPPSPGSPAP
jgi:hypothetical protein